MEYGEVDPPKDRFGTWSLTVSGIAYWPLDPRPEEVSIYDIAHALSMLCRYTGHTTRFYSVAEHCLYVSKMVPPHLALEGLMHDATEAYVADLNRPVKSACKDYREVEKLNEIAIRKRFKLLPEEPAEVKRADMDILVLEKEQICPQPNDNYKWTWCGVKPEGMRIVGLTPEQAKYCFLRRFRQLGGLE